MKILILLLTLVIFKYVSCNESILSKFHQTGFKLKDMRTEVVRYNKSFVHFFELKTFKYNRTTAAHNCTFSAKVSLEDKLEVLIQSYKFLSNEFRYFPVRFQVNLNKAFEANIMGLRAVKMCGNITNFIIQKDIIYHFCNFVVDDTCFPPLIPDGIYKDEFRVLYLNQEVLVVNLYGEIYTPVAYPKK